MAGNSRKAVIAALLANGGIAVAKFAGFAITRSASMLAEGVHSVADTGNQGLLLLGSRRGRKAATPEHPFGYGRERYFWSFIVALVLFTLDARVA
jgi:divalent metal cation (Fe/Co/Zn/Cd) transporter